MNAIKQQAVCRLPGTLYPAVLSKPSSSKKSAAGMGVELLSRLWAGADRLAFCPSNVLASSYVLDPWWYVLAALVHGEVATGRSAVPYSGSSHNPVFLCPNVHDYAQLVECWLHCLYCLYCMQRRKKHLCIIRSLDAARHASKS